MARPATSTGTGGVQVIARAAQILRALDGEPHGLSSSQLSERLDLPRSTVHRVASALSAEGLMASASPNGRVRLGPEIARLALASRRELRLELRPHLQRLFDRLNETVDWAVLDGDHLRFIDAFDALVADVMTSEPYASAQRVFRVVDNGTIHRGEKAIARLQGTWPNLVLVHLPRHASWLNRSRSTSRSSPARR